MRIALDAMGGDQAPHTTVRGAVEAAPAGFQILLVGDEAVLRDEISLVGGLPPNVRIQHAPDFVEMEDSPGSTLRHKKDSSLRVAFELVRNEQADALVTMGHSGAALAMGMFVSGRLEGILRPAIAALVPHEEHPVVLLDVGATVDCRPEHLHQYASMGSALARTAFAIDKPGVAILANGQELEKGTDLTRSAAARIRDDRALNFLGYVEPADFLAGAAPVVVTDGWTGNLILKTAEATVSHLTAALGDAARANVLAKTGALLLKPSLDRNLSHLDGSEVGGGILLGIQACAVIGHGASDATGVANALSFAARLAKEGLLEELEKVLSSPA